MKTVTTLIALLLITIPQFSLAIGYKVQIYNGSSQAINIIAGHAPIDKPISFKQCKWANTNYDLSNQNNWSKSTFKAWHSSVWSPRAIQSGKHRALWCLDDRPKRWERRFRFYVDCDGDGEGNPKYTQTYPRNHLSSNTNYVFSLDGSHCLPN
tara:strand:+ start:90 stop:548 length:459 start_codon:yes stop_codon:yes gene_type:complete